MMGDGTNLLSRLLSAKEFPADAFWLDRALAGRPVIVYGAGEAYHYFEEVVVRRGYVPSLVLDRRFRPGDVFQGTPACSLADCTLTAEDRHRGLVVICGGRREVEEEIRRDLKQAGFSHAVALREIYEIHNPFALPCRLAKEGFGFFAACEERMLSCLELWGDDESRDVYLRCLQTHLTRTPVAIPARAREEQYVPPDQQGARGSSRLIQCGVSVGEFSRVLRQAGAEACQCYEPHPGSFLELMQYLSQDGGPGCRVDARLAAVFSENGRKRFRTSGATSFGSMIADDGAFEVDCVTIDAAASGFHPTRIVMDVEGSELEALRGAEETLREDRPDLAVCVYHSVDHLWEIPLYLHQLGLSYRLFLRNYTSLCLETVLYAFSD